MLKWFQKYRMAGRETKLFIATSILWTLAVILPGIFCYARLDFVRSGQPPVTSIEKQNFKN